MLRESYMRGRMADTKGKAMKMMLTAAAGLCAAAAVVGMAGFGQPRKDPPTSTQPAAPESPREADAKKAQPAKIATPGKDAKPHGAEPDDPAQPRALGALSKLAFLQGTWTGLMHGDPVEETWSAPVADGIMGMFRWQAEGKTTMWEMLAITVQDDKPVLRLRHFDAKFEPWKGECESIVPLPASTVEDAKVVFTNSEGKGGLVSCEYELEGRDTLKVTVSFKDPQREALKFELKKKISRQW